MTPDEDFIIDTLPGCKDLMVITDLSGHGFKFSSVLGEVATLFAQNKTPSVGLSAFVLQRFNCPSPADPVSAIRLQRANFYQVRFINLLILFISSKNLTVVLLYLPVEFPYCSSLV